MCAPADLHTRVRRETRCGEPIVKFENRSKAFTHRTNKAHAVNVLPFGIPNTMREEHEELHSELRKATKMPGPVGKAAKNVAEVLHPHFEKENELALPIIGITRELGEGKSSEDFTKASDLYERFRPEYENMLREHIQIVEALDKLEAAAKKAKKGSVIKFAQKLKLHAKTEEDLTYPAILMAGKLLKQQQ